MYMSQHTYNIHDVLHIPYKKTHPPAGSVLLAPLCLPAERYAYHITWIHIIQYASLYNVSYCIILYHIISYIILLLCIIILYNIAYCITPVRRRGPSTWCRYIIHNINNKNIILFNIAYYIIPVRRRGPSTWCRSASRPARCSRGPRSPSSGPSSPSAAAPSRPGW